VLIGCTVAYRLLPNSGVFFLYFLESSDKRLRNVITSRAGASHTRPLLVSASTTPTTTPIQVSSDEFTGDAEAQKPLIYASFCTPLNHLEPLASLS
jgi:hypothetical protein